MIRQVIGLILYHGWSDPALSPTATIDYYRDVIPQMGQKAAKAVIRPCVLPLQMRPR